MKLYRATVYYRGLDECDEDLIFKLENCEDIVAKVFNEEEVEIGEWYDEIDINKCDCPLENFEKYFEKDLT